MTAHPARVSTMVYVEAPTGTVHLARNEPVGVVASRTRCGLRIDASGWSYGDETMSGLVATCRRCRPSGKGQS